MTPETFAQAIVSIERNYGLRLDARSVWLKMDGFKKLARGQMGRRCGRGWVGLLGVCMRVPKGGDKDATIKASKVAFADRIRKMKGFRDRNVPKLERSKIGLNNQQVTTQGSIIGAFSSRRINGSHDDLPIELKDQISTIQNLTGMSEDEAKSSIKAIKSYASLEGGGDGVVSFGSIRNVQRGIFNAGEIPPHWGNPLTKSEIAEVQSSIESIDRYVKKMPAFDGVIHRGMSFKTEDERTAFLSKISNGYSLEAMSSFSSSREMAGNFAGSSNKSVVFTVKNKSGASIKQLSEIKNEDEVLVPKDVKYSISPNLKRLGEIILVEMEEI